MEHTVQTEVRSSGRYERTLTVRIDEQELERAKDRAARKLSKSMKIKGFRPGKAPRALVERMVGAQTLRSEAIEDAIPDVVGSALAEAELEPVTVPQVADIRDGEAGGVEVDVLVTLWPELDAIPDYAGRQIEIEPPEVTQEEIDRQLDALREQFAELETAERVATDGDFVLVDITALQGDTTLEDASAGDLLYEIGSHSFIPGLDEILRGAVSGDIREGPATLPPGFTEHGGEEVTLRVLVKEVRVKKLPPLTDELVTEATEFATVEELVTAIRDGLRRMKVAEARSRYRDRLIEELVDDLDLDLPKALVDAEVEARVRGLLGNLEREGIGFADYLRATGQDQETFLADVRAQAERALSTRVLLESVIAIDGIEVTDEEFERAVASLAASVGVDAAGYLEAVREHGRVEALTDDILRRKALEHLAEAATPVDASGNPVDLTIAEAASEEDAGENDGDGADEGPRDEDPEPDIEE